MSQQAFRINLPLRHELGEAKAIHERNKQIQGRVEDFELVLETKAIDSIFSFESKRLDSETKLELFKLDSKIDLESRVIGFDRSLESKDILESIIDSIVFAFSADCFDLLCKARNDGGGG